MSPEISPKYLAQKSSVEKFLAAYQPEMARGSSAGGSLNALSGAVTNRDLEARVFITNRLLDDGADPSVSGDDGTNLLHQLFFQREHDFVAEAPVLARLFAGGADINEYSPKWGRPLQVLMENRGLRDRLLGPFYDVIFAQPGIDWEVPVSLKSQAEKRTLRELVEAAGERRPEMLRRMREYLADGPSPLPA